MAGFGKIFTEGLTRFGVGCVTGVAALLRSLMTRFPASPHLVAGALCCLATVTPAQSQPGQMRSYNLPRGDATTTLKQFAGASGRQIVYMMDKVRGETTNAVSGSFAPQEALDRMLAGTGLVATTDRQTGAFVVSRQRLPETPEQAGEVGPKSDPQTKPKPKVQPVKSSKLVSRVAAFIALLAPPLLDAQTAAEREKAAKSDEAIVLSPFTVQSEKDTGYQATSTLAGSRLNTPIKDIGASISVYTKDFLNDIGATNANELLIYATGMEAAGPGGNFSNGAGANITETNVVGDSVRNAPQGGTRARGLAGPTYTRGFFVSEVPIDGYNTSAVTVNRGPNAILFGVASPSGVVDTTLLQADVRRNTNRTEFRYGDNDSLRASVDFNRVVVPKRLALRLGALADRVRYAHRPSC